MLDSEPDNNTGDQTGTEQAAVRPRRRAASRPAGPPRTATTEPAEGTAGTAPTEAAAPAAEPEAPAAEPEAPATEADASAGAAAKKTTAKKTTAKKTTAKKATAKKTAAKKTTTKKTAAKKTTAKKTTARKTAETETDVLASDADAPASEATAAQTAPEAAQQPPLDVVAEPDRVDETVAETGDETPAPVKKAAAKKTASKRTAKKATAKKTTTRRTAKKAAAEPEQPAIEEPVIEEAADNPAVDQAVDQAVADATVAPDPSIEAAIESALLAARAERTAETGSADESADEGTDRSADESADQLDDRADEQADEQADDRSEESRDESDDESDEERDDETGERSEGGSRRRRRRRGGRRRRRGRDRDEDRTDDQSDEQSDDTDEADHGSDAGPDSAVTAAEAGTDDVAKPTSSRRRRGERKAAADSADDAQADDKQDSKSDSKTGGPDEGKTDDKHDDRNDDGDDSDEGGRRRRRRRRRRRGEDTAGAPDDPTEVVVRVREPRKASDEVTGIDGSTRMEAKRQRRREGREAGRRRAPIISEAEFLARRESVNRKMVIRQRDDLAQIAVLEDGILVEHYVDRESANSLIGNVYLGRVQNVLPSMEAAFIDIGRGRNAVLYAGEVDWDSFGANGPDRKVEKVLKSGQTVLVQVTKDPVGAKGARLTNHVSIPGRYVVYAPGGHLSGISRKLPDTERKRLKDILDSAVGETGSVIVRTAAEGASEEELTRDVNRLKAQWEDIERKVKSGSAPQLLYAEPDLTLRIVRDLFTEDFSELIIQGNGSMTDAYDAIGGYVQHVAPHLADRIRRWDAEANGDLFGSYRLDEQIAKGLERKVFLPSGGSLIIDRTEAMTVIDVNTGKFTGSGGNLEATITSNNLEAAEEIVRQLRLRDIGGIIVIDFIDMVLPSNRELLLRRLVECLGRDRTRHQVAEVTSLGLVQMTRKRIGTGLLEAFSTECPHCHGRGVELHDVPVADAKMADGGAREDQGGGKGGRRRNRGRRGGKDGNSDSSTTDGGSDGSDAANSSASAESASVG